MGVAFRAFVHSGWFLSLVVIGICFQCFGASAGFCSSWGAFCFAVLVVLPLVLCFFSSWCYSWQWFFDAGHCYWCLCAGLFFFLLVVVCWRLGGCCPPGVFIFFPRVVALAFVLWPFFFVLWGFCFLLSNCPLQLLLMVCVIIYTSGLLLLPPLLLFFLFFFPFLPFLGFLLLWLSVFSVVSFLLPLPGIAWCLAFPCAWFGRPFLTSFCCCSCFVLNCMGFLVVVAVLAVVMMVVVGNCLPLVYG